MGRYLIAALLTCFMVVPPGMVSGEEVKGPEKAILIGTFIPEPGAWSEYTVLERATGKRVVLRMSIVGTEDDSFWYEVVTRKEGGQNVVKMLVNGNPNNTANIRRLIMKVGNNPAMEMPPDYVFMGRRMANDIFLQRSGITTDQEVGLRNVETGKGTVTVPAGTFDVELHRIEDTAGRVYAEYTFTSEVAPFGVVSLDAEKTAIILEGHGTGARSLIPENPAMMTLPPEMKPDRAPPGGMVPSPGSGIKEIPGMGTGYEPKK